ncbi:hypothetical protein AX16_002743 [Volvariella volvacea WC 439]|nr:hypothetical protein AX16_002743 [Volvariella volvacea WC 439]
MAPATLPSEDEIKAAYDNLGGQSKYDEFVKNVEDLERHVLGIPPAHQIYPIEGSVVPVLPLSQDIPSPFIWLNLAAPPSSNQPNISGRGFGHAEPRPQHAFDFRGKISFVSWDDVTNNTDSFVLRPYGEYLIIRFSDKEGRTVALVRGRTAAGVKPPEAFIAQGSFTWTTSKSDASFV